MKPWLFVALDPGDAHVGLAEFAAVPGPPRPHLTAAIDASDDGRLNLMQCLTLDPASAVQWLELNLRRMRALVLERWQLYPWLAREQGFSEFLASQFIGVAKYLAGRVDAPVYLQDAKGTLREGRKLAQEHGFAMKDRRLGSGRFAYRGPDFDLSGPPHRRDAASHGVFFAYRNGESPLVRNEAVVPD